MTNFDAFLTSRKGLTFLALLITLGLGITIGSILSDEVTKASQTEPHKLKITGEGSPVVLDEEISLREGFRRIAETVEPAVVNISTQSIVESSSAQNPHPEQLREFFGDEFWERFFGSPDSPRQQKRTSLGSGVIVDSTGYILSNHHVVAPIERRGVRRNADKIEVQMHNGETYEAQVIGVDPESDLAVLKISSDKPLPFAQVGDSTKLHIGDWVMAIGSPFGLEQTVTAGIVSQTQRIVPSTRIFGDYIQTDAAINPGNSGGPLVNMKGEVVGINSFISTNTGSFVGIGFAVPSSVFVNSYNQLVSTGKIERGWLGVSMNTFPMTPELAKYFGVNGDDRDGIKNGDGVVITQLIDENGDQATTGPAAKAGVKPEDVIVKFGPREIKTLYDLRVAVANTPPGEEVPVVVVRHGEVIELNVVLAERTLEARQRAENEGLSFEEEPDEEEKPKEIGLEFQTLSSREATQLNLDDVKGVLILDVTPGSLADDAGLRRSLVVTHVNGVAVPTARAFKDAVTDITPGTGVVLRVIQGSPDGQRSIAFTSFVKP
ncbi:MAG: trypsin-like peptidase domain-containing protein [Acidobacteriota bacterium]|nr:MAG: trypsin-like peptidase domain-containing protein [Acidobacteriota bacterium]